MRTTRQKDTFANTNRHYSLRKLRVGLASVLIGLSFASVTKIQTVKADSLNQASAYLCENEKMQTSSVPNSVAEPQKNLLENAENNQTEAKNQENRLADQSNYKQTNQNSTNNNQDSGQNLTDHDETKQGPTDKNDVENGIIGSGSLQEPDNHAGNRSQTQPQNSKKLDLTKNRQLAKKVLATNLIATSPITNGGFDESTWGKLDVTKWQGSAQNGVYQLTSYTGDPSHIIIPNEADFEQAGKSTNGLQVGITSDTARSFLSNRAQTIAFSKTNNQKVEAIGTDWSHSFSSSALSKFDGSSLDVSNVTNMNSMFGGMFMFNNNSISDLTSLANWNTSKVTDMSYMFNNNSISDLTPLANWDVSNVTNMRCMFTGNKISDLTPLANWDVSNVTNMSAMFDHNSISNLTPLVNWNVSDVTDMDEMFERNSISNLTPLTNWDTSKATKMYGMFASNQISDLTPLANWDTGKVTNMNRMFASNHDIKDLKPIANWNMSSVSVWGLRGFFESDAKLDLANINNTPLMQGFLKTALALQGATFITNNVDLVKATTGQDLPILTNTAKRTITFYIPHATPETIVQIINYKAIATVQVDCPVPKEIVTMVFASVRQPVQSDGPKIIKTYPVKESDWQLDTSKQNDAVIIDGVICFKPVKIPHINGYKAHLIKDPVNPNALLVSFIALPEQLQNNQSNNLQPTRKPVQPEQNQPELIKTRPAEKQKQQQVDQGIDYISDTLIHNSSSNADSFEPVQNDSAPLEASSDSTQNGDTAKIQKVNTAKHKKHIVKKRAVKRRRKHAKKYRLKRRSKKYKKHSRKHTKCVKHVKKRIIKHRKRASRKFRKYNLKHIKKA